MHLLSRFAQCLVFAAFSLTSAAAMADSLPGQDEDFAAADVVSDKDLSSMRGSYMGVDFTFVSRTLVGDQVLRTMVVSSNDLMNGAFVNIPPAIINNNLDNVTITNVNSLNASIDTAAVYAAQAANMLSSMNSVSQAKAAF